MKRFTTLLAALAAVVLFSAPAAFAAERHGPPRGVSKHAGHHNNHGHRGHQGHGDHHRKTAHKTAYHSRAYAPVRSYGHSPYRSYSNSPYRSYRTVPSYGYKSGYGSYGYRPNYGYSPGGLSLMGRHFGINIGW